MNSQGASEGTGTRSGVSEGTGGQIIHGLAGIRPLAHVLGWESQCRVRGRGLTWYDLGLTGLLAAVLKIC